jgi:hypothetical protein
MLKKRISRVYMDVSPTHLVCLVFFVIALLESV